jgi:glyoxylase I family protein
MLEAATGSDGRGPARSDPAGKEQLMADFPPLTHVALTVRDLSVSVPWYQALFDAAPVLDEDTDPDFHHTVYLVGNTLVGLHQHAKPAPDERFSEFRVGLDHVAFGCADRAELESWVRRLDELGVEHSEIKDRGYGSGVSFRDPDGIALEFFAPPS